MFTPGPWTVKRLPNGEVFVWSEAAIVKNDRGPDFHQEILSDEDYPTKEDDARLIAAAPELLAALEGLYGAIDSCVELTPNVLQTARAAIKKAKGE